MEEPKHCRLHLVVGKTRGQLLEQMTSISPCGQIQTRLIALQGRKLLHFPISVGNCLLNTAASQLPVNCRAYPGVELVP